MSKESKEDKEKQRRLLTKGMTSRDKALRLIELLDFSVSQLRDNVIRAEYDDAFGSLEDASSYVIRVANLVRKMETNQ